MNSRRYWKNRLPFLLTNLVCMAALTVFLLVCGNSVSAVLLILIVWALVLLTGLILTYWKRKRQMKKLLDMAEQLSERYLISEVMELPEQAEDQVYYQLLKMAGKSMLEQIGEVERERLEYKEYIEQWIHEIKTPITAMKLLCENHRMDWTKELLLELEKTNRFTEQALYYARSEHTEKDYSVREMALSQVVHQAIADNKYLLLQGGMRLEVEEMQDTVYSDEKWVRFILNQLIANAVKYRTEQPVLRISTHKRQDQVVLVVEDNGIGIAASDLPRIFEKGFTGQNGRMVQQSTGIGLYLCKRLCEKLGIGITAESSEHGTAISLSFHISLIAYNAKFINEGNTKLFYGPDFVFVSGDSQEDTAEKITERYCLEIQESGIENVQILSPFRSEGAASSEQLNETIRELVNPFRSAEEEIKFGPKIFRINDRIMQTKNTEKVSNGDLGFIRYIKDTDQGKKIGMDFGAGRTLEYGVDDLSNVDLAYATTIHKAMGSEYETVIMPLLKAHTIMMYRNLLYTGITRAKKRVVLIGQKQVLFMAIHRNEIGKRNTLLGMRIQMYFKAYAKKAGIPIPAALEEQLKNAS